MKVSKTRFEKLMKHNDDIRSSINVLESDRKRIIIWGIMLFLISVLWSSVIMPLRILSLFLEQKKTSWAESLGTQRRETGRQNAAEENTLTNIFEIIGKVGMRMVCPSAIPASPLPFFVSSSRSFGASHCASSEGFLATFTPGAVVVFCDYGLLSEDATQCLHRFIPFTIQDGSPVPARNSPPKELPPNPRNPPNYERMNRSSHEGCFPGEALRHNLMTIDPLGILVALNPTDEGRIGTGRNT
jgi:hypothetical protein